MAVVAVCTPKQALLRAMAAFGEIDGMPSGATMLTSTSGGRSAAREARMQEYGIDCGDGLSWDGGTWEPGGEYVKRLRVKNISGNMQRVRWQLPETKFFSMDFPDPVRLAPGNSVLLEVRFRPVHREEYEDGITFTVDAGTFVVPVRARLSRLGSSIPPSVQFGLVPVNEPTSVAFTLDNTGQVPASFRWDCPAPFVVEPASGIVQPGESAELVCTILADNAAILHGTATVDVRGIGDDVAGSGRQQHVLLLAATSKFQHILVEQEEIDLGDVMVGSGVTERIVIVHNPGPVRATVTVTAVEKDRRPHFTLSPNVVVIDGDGGTAELCLRYVPRVHGSFSCERFQLSTPGGSSATVEAKACARGPKVSLARKDAAGRPSTAADTSFAFGDVSVGERRSQICRIRNASDAPAQFSILAEAGGIFGFSQTQGTVPARLFADVVVSFGPRCPGNFYRRVFVLVRDGEPLFVDLLGSGMDERTRPFPIRQRHIDAYRLRPAMLRLMAPDTVKQVAELHNAAAAQGLDPEEVLPAKHGVAALTSPLTRALEAELSPARRDDRTRASLTPSEERPRAGSALIEQMLLPPDHETKPFVLSDAVLRMGSANAGAIPPKRTVSITNRSAGKVTVQWHVPVSSLPPAEESAAASGAGATGAWADPPRDFAVSPPVCDIEAGGTAEFSVAFRPHQAGAWYAQELEAVVVPKQNRTFRLVDDVSFTPPETLLLRVMGSSFSGGGSFLPRFSTSLGAGVVGPLRLDMPACATSSIVHAVFELRNDGEVPAAFEIAPPDPSGVLTIAPALGLVPVGAFVLLVVRFAPPREGNFMHNFQLLLNGDAAASPSLTVRGVCASPSVALPDGGAIFAPPTAIGATSSVVVPLANASRVPASFHLQVPHALSDMVQVAPACGVIRGNETQQVRVTFCPRHRGHCAVHLRCDVFGGGARAFAALGASADALNTYRPMRSFEARDLMSATSKAAAVTLPATNKAAARGAASATAALPGSGAGLSGTAWLEDEEDCAAAAAAAGPGGRAAAAGQQPGSGGQGLRPGARLLLLPPPSAGGGGARAGGESKDAEGGGAEGKDAEEDRGAAPPERADGESPLEPLEPAPPADPAAVWPWDEAAAVASLSATVVSEGTDGALAFSPPGADLGPCLVGEGIHRAVGLENRSGCTLRWRLEAVAEVDDISRDDADDQARNDRDADGEADEAAERTREKAAASREGAGRLGSRGSRLLNSARSGTTDRRGATDDGGAGGLTLTFDAEASAGSLPLASEDSIAPHSSAVEARFEPSEGTLPARSRTQVDVSAVARLPGRVTVRVAYSLESIDSTGVVTKQGDESRQAARAAAEAADAVRAEAQAVAARTGVAVVPPPAPLNQDGVWCDIRALAGYPTLVVEDARRLSSREALLWLFPARLDATAGSSEELSKTSAAQAALAALPSSASDADPLAGAETGGADILDALLAEAATAARSAAGSMTTAGDAIRRAASGSSDNHAAQHRGRVTSLGSTMSAGSSFAGGSTPPGAALALAMPEPEPRFAADRAGGWQFRLPAPLALPWQGPLSAATVAAFQGWVEGQPQPRLPAISSPHRLWEQCSLRDLNRALAKRLSPAEVAQSQAQPSARDASDLSTVTVEFTPAPLGSPPDVVLWQLRNVGGLPAVVDVAFPSDAEIEAEAWAEPTEPSRAEVRTRQLLERRVFDVQPRQLRILPGACATLVLHYAHVTAALADGPNSSHQVEVLLKIRRGRTVRLRLRGQTLRPHLPSLWLGSPALSRRLDPVPLGVRRAPVQLVRVCNPTAEPVRFHVDPRPLRAACEASHGFDVWECLTPSGLLAPQSEDVIKVRFTPLEARDYAVELRVRFGMADTGSPIVRAIRALEEEAGITVSEVHSFASDFEDKLGQPRAPAAGGGMLAPAALRPAGAGTPGAGAASEGEQEPVMMDELVDGAVAKLESALSAAQVVADAAGLGDAAVAGRLRKLELQRGRRRRALGLAPNAEVTPAMLRALATDVTVVLRARGYTPWSVVDADEEGALRTVDAAAPSVRPGLLPYGEEGAAAETALIAAGGTSVRSAMRSDGLEGDAEEEAAEAGDDSGAADALGQQPSVSHVAGGGAAVASGASAGASADAGHGWSSVSLPRALLSDDQGADGAASVLTADAILAPVGSVVMAAATPSAHMARIHSILGRLRLAPDSAPSAASDESALGRASKPPAKTPRPGTAPPAFHCGAPPLRRHLRLPAPWLSEGLARAVPEWLRFGDVPVGARAHRVVVLVNERSAPTPGVGGTGGLARGGGGGGEPDGAVTGGEGAAGRIAMKIGRSAGFGKGGGVVVFAWDESHPMLRRGGPLTVHPRRGRLEPGETAVCRVTLTAGAHPMVLEMDLPVAVAIPEEEMVSRVTVARRRAAAWAFQEQQLAARKPPEPNHIPVALKSTSARNARIQTAAAEKHLRASYRERSTAGDVVSVAKSRGDRRQRRTREAQAGAADGASVVGRRAGTGQPEELPAAVALGAGRKGLRAEDIGASESASGGGIGPLGGTPLRPGDAAEARVAGVVAAVREVLETASSGAGGSGDDATQAGGGRAAGGGKSAAGRSVASSRSRLSSAKATAAVDAAAASIPTPVPPATTLCVHLSARVCGEDEFRQAHGSSRLASFLCAAAMGASEAGLPEQHGEAARQSVPDADEELRGAAAGGPVEADLDAAPQAVDGAGGGTQGRHVMQAVLTDLLADLVSGADISPPLQQDGTVPGDVPTFRELAARRGRCVHGHDADADNASGAARPANSTTDAARARTRALRSAELRRLCSKFVHTTLHNIARDAAAGAVDFSKLPKPMITLGGRLPLH